MKDKQVIYMLGNQSKILQGLKYTHQVRSFKNRYSISIPYMGDFSHIGAPIWEKSPIQEIDILYRFINDRSYYLLFPSLQFQIHFKMSDNYYKISKFNFNNFNIQSVSSFVMVNCSRNAARKRKQSQFGKTLRGPFFT